MAGAATEQRLWKGGVVMVSGLLGMWLGRLCCWGMAPTRLPPISLNRKYGVGVGEGSFLLIDASGSLLPTSSQTTLGIPRENWVGLGG